MATTATASGERLLTIEEYLKLPENGRLTELVRGRVITLNPPYPWHGFVCINAAAILLEFVKPADLGYVTGNDSGVITGNNPDTLRGADVAFYSYARVPKGTIAKKGYLDIAPDLIFEVRSPGDRWKDVLAKVAEYLNAGVSVVCVLDPERQTATVYEPDQPETKLTADQELTFPTVLPGFSVRVERFFN